MDSSLLIKPIGIIHSPYKEKFGVPRQSNLTPNTISYITFLEEFQNPDCFRGIEEYSHLWLVWNFSENTAGKWSPTVRPPRLGGNTRKGVFATRSPFRPNPIGLSCVLLDHIDYLPTGPVLYIRGADLMDQTPIYDIKPYIPYTDSHPKARYEFAKQGLSHRLKVLDPENILSFISTEYQESLIEALSLDPRPAYQDDPSRVYGMCFHQYDVKFRVDGNDLFITEIKKVSQE